MASDKNKNVEVKELRQRIQYLIETDKIPDSDKLALALRALEIVKQTKVQRRQK